MGGTSMSRGVVLAYVLRDNLLIGIIAVVNYLHQSSNLDPVSAPVSE